MYIDNILSTLEFRCVLSGDEGGIIVVLGHGIVRHDVHVGWYWIVGMWICLFCVLGVDFRWNDQVEKVQIRADGTLLC